MDEPARGMVVMGPEGQLGIVDDVIYENTGDPARVMVRRNNGDNILLQPGSYWVENGALHLGAGGTAQAMQRPLGGVSGEATGGYLYRTQQLQSTSGVETRDVPPGEGMVIPVIREEARVTRREVEQGGVRVHKRVDEREEVVEQPTYREQVTVERVTLGQPIEQEIGSRQEGDTLIIPVLEEMLVVEKRLVLKEEIRITKRRIEETEQARIVLREEHVDIEELGGADPVA